MKRVVISSILILKLALAEPSVYSGGGGYSPGSNNLAIINEKISRLQEQIDGIKSILQGLEQKVNRLSNQKVAPSSNPQDLEDILYRLNRLEKIVNGSAKRYSKVKSTKKIVKKESHKKNSLKPQKKQPPIQETKKIAKLKPPTTSTKLSSAELLKSAKEDISNRKLQSAEDKLNRLLRKGYKKAESYFLLGEVAYLKGRYSNAIEFYQKSAEKSADAKYMDRLLLHTAIALKKSGQKSQAKEFFKTLIETYPNSVSAATARRYLKSMR